MTAKLRVHHVLFLIVMALGFTLRLSQPTLVEFKRDEATIARLGQAIAYEGFRPAVGVDSSLGIDNLPLTLYLVAAPLRLWSDPVSAVLFTALLNSLALVACYLLARAAFGTPEALLSTLLFATSPWAVLYARKIWARTLPLFTLMFVGALFLTFVRRKRWALVPAFVALAALLGLQLEALAFVPILAVALLLYRDAVSWRPLLVGALAFAVLLAPYALHDMAQGWQNLRGLSAYAGGEGAFSGDAVRYALTLVGSKGIEGQAGPFFRQFRDSLPRLWWIDDLLSALLVAALGYGLYQAVRGHTQERRRTFALLLFWFVVPVLLQLKPSAPTQPHYFVMHYPVQYILIATLLLEGVRWLLGKLAGRGSVWLFRLALGGAICTLAVVCGWQVLVTGQLRWAMVSHPTTGGYGIPLRYTRQAAQVAVDVARGGEVLVVGREAHPFVTETPTVFDALLFGTPHRFVDGRSSLPFPDRERFVYLVGPLAATGDEELRGTLDRLARFPSMAIGPYITLPDRVVYQTYIWQGADREEVLTGMSTWEGGVPFGNDVVFAAYELAPDASIGRELSVWLAWWTRAVPGSDSDYHFTVRLLDGAGTTCSQEDHAAFPSRTWQAGDLVLSRFRLPLRQDLPAGNYRVRAGMYRYPQIEGVPVVSSQGDPVDDGVTLGEIRLEGAK